MTETRLKALEIIGAWIDNAHAITHRDMSRHKIAFWLARDILEGLLNVPAKDYDETLEFIKTSCKESADRGLLLVELTLARDGKK